MQDDLKERLREVVQNVEAAKRHVYGLPIAAIRSDTHGNKMALWCDNGMAGVGQVCVAVNVGEFPDDQLAAIAGLANAALSAAKYAEHSIVRIAALEADNARLMETLQFYAREQSWRSMGMHMCGHSPDSTAVIDGGKRARATLAKIKETPDA